MSVTVTDWRTIYVLSVAAFAMCFQFFILSNIIWPYLHAMDPTVTESTYGLVQSTWSIGFCLGAPVAGYLSNRLHKFKFAPFEVKLLSFRILLIFGLILGVLAAGLYLSLEFLSSSQVIVVGATQLLLGFLLLIRAQISMVSTVADRSQALSYYYFTSGIGQIVAPCCQWLFAKFLHYPGIAIFGMPLRLHLYTAPAFSIVFVDSICALISFILLTDHYPIPRAHDEPALPENRLEVDVEGDSDNVELLPNAPQRERFPFDTVAVVFCIVLNINQVMDFCIMTSLASPLSMTMFYWSSEQAVSWLSLSNFIASILQNLFFLAYSTIGTLRKINERVGSLVGLTSILLYFLSTYPWFFLTEKIRYQENATDPDAAGCPTTHTWCEDIPAINDWVFMVAYTLLGGLIFPIIMLNCDTLFTKVLGPIKQGMMQGIYSGVGGFFGFVGVIGATKLYDLTGPRIIWFILECFIVLMIVSIVVLYRRLVPNPRRANLAEIIADE